MRVVDCNMSAAAAVSVARETPTNCVKHAPKNRGFVNRRESAGEITACDAANRTAGPLPHRR